MRIYRQWAGNERGTKEDRKRGYGPEGLYCKQHAKKLEAGRHLHIPEDNIE